MTGKDISETAQQSHDVSLCLCPAQVEIQLIAHTCVDTIAAFAPYVDLLESNEISIQPIQFLDDFCQLIPARDRRVMHPQQYIRLV